jgi:cardiolipin synthase
LWLKGIGALNRRDHRKILVVDESIAFTGGLNIGDEYAAKEDGGAGWRDTHCRVDCPETSRQLLALTEAAWWRAEQLSSPATPPAGTDSVPQSSRIVASPNLGAAGTDTASPAVSTGVPVQVLNNREFLKRIRVRQAYLRAIRRAKCYILIENAYFIPDRRIRRALRNAVKRGVAVAVVVPMYSDVPIVALASKALYGELLSSGVRLFEYPVSMLHCKAAVIDDVWLVVSSYNLDHRSLLHNLEAGVLVLDRALAHAMRKRIVADIELCQEITPELHAAQPWNRALKQVLAYQLRYWL